jgi:hypothetical protein
MSDQYILRFFKVALWIGNTPIGVNDRIVPASWSSESPKHFFIPMDDRSVKWPTWEELANNKAKTSSK